MRRIDIIKKIMNFIKGEFIITSAGKISREVYYVRDRPRNFYVQGSMGSSLAIGIGLAICRPKEKVVVIAGDGEVLMSLSTLVLMKKLKLPNLKLYIIDNNCFQSTGGQKTNSDAVDFKSLCDCEVFKVDSESEEVPRIGMTHKEIKERFMKELK